MVLPLDTGFIDGLSQDLFTTSLVKEILYFYDEQSKVKALGKDADENAEEASAANSMVGEAQIAESRGELLSAAGVGAEE